MALFETDHLELVVGDYYDDMSDFEDDNFEQTQHQQQLPGVDSDIEDDLEMEEEKAKTDTSAAEVRNGKDIQGIPWERLNFTRDNYREMRLKQYNNYQSLPPCSCFRGQRHEEEYKQAENANVFYDFQFSTRLVKSTIVHFQSWFCTIY